MIEGLSFIERLRVKYFVDLLFGQRCFWVFDSATPEQQAAREEERKKQLEQEIVAREEKRRNQALLNTYSSEKDLQEGGLLDFSDALKELGPR